MVPIADMVGLCDVWVGAHLNSHSCPEANGFLTNVLKRLQRQVLKLGDDSNEYTDLYLPGKRD